MAPSAYDADQEDLLSLYGDSLSNGILNDSIGSYHLVCKNLSIKYEKNGLVPSDISLVTVYKDANSIKLVGPQGIDGAVYIETKAFARNKYWHLFSRKSREYLNAVPNPQSDSSVAYILNGKVLKENFEGDLSVLDDKSLIELSIIDVEKLKKDFNVFDKRVGVLLKANVKGKK